MGYLKIASPQATRREMERKLSDYFAAGVKVVWLVYLPTREVVVHTSPNSSVTLRGDDSLDGGELLPGFSITIAQLFAELDRTEA